MNTSFPILTGRKSSLRAMTFLALVSLIPGALGQTVAAPDLIQLDDYVVTAARTPQRADEVASRVTVIRPGALADQQINSLGDALRSVPGVTVVQTGGVGGVTSLLVRGSKTTQTLLLIDGVRFNDPNTSYSGWLGGFAPGLNDRIEVLRGPQSTLYGGAAMGGVISVGLTRGQGPDSGVAAVEVGSFSSLNGSLSAQGADDSFAYSFHASATETDNDRPDNKASLRNYALRMDYQISPTLAVGGTFRYLDSAYRDPNDIRTFNSTPISNNDLTSRLTTVFAEVTVSEQWMMRLTGAHQQQIYDNDGSYSGFPSPYRTDSTRQMLDWQNTVRVSDAVTLVGGANYERSAFTDGGDYPDDKLAGSFGQAEWNAAGALRLGVGLRYDDYSSFGEVVTGRLTASRLFRETGTRGHATYGTSFLPPSLSQRYGSAYTDPSPGIQAEESTGWDAGITQILVAEKLTVDATYFQNRYKNLIAYQGAIFPEQGNFRNIGRAESWGVETEFEATLSAQVLANASWTYLEATDETSGARLTDRPRHTFAANVMWRATSAWIIGVGWQGVSNRIISDFNSFPSVQLNPGDYATVRIYVHYRVSDRLSLRARAENVLNRAYEETYGFPSAGAAFYAGAEWKF